MRIIRQAMRGGVWLGAAMLVASGGQAQTVLPEIVVTAPSPIVPRVAAGPAAGPGETQGTLPIVDTAFVPVTVVPRQTIERSPGGTLGELLFDKPGITASTFAPGASRPIIRGLDNFRVGVLENGVGSQDVSTLGEDHGVPIDPLATDQVEVVRGPATLRFGSQAIGGVVNAVNNRIPDRLPEQGLTFESRGAFTSVDRGREGAVILHAGNGSVAVHADAFARGADDYRIPGGRQLNTALNAEGQSVGASYIFNQGFVGAAIAHMTSLYHIPGAEEAARNTRIDLEQTKLMSKGEFRPDADAIEAIRFWFGATNYHHNEISIDSGADGVRATFRNREEEGRLEMQLSPVMTRFGEWKTALGAQLGHRALGTDGEAGSLLAPSETRTVAGYIFNELGLTDTVKLQIAGRIESIGVDGTEARVPADFLPTIGNMTESPRRRDFTPRSFSIGVLKDLPLGIVASLTGQYVERAPSAPELFSKGPHDASGTFEIGDPDLTKEAASSIELGLRRARGQFRFDAALFHTRYQGFIFKRLTGNRCGDDFASCGIDTELTQVVYSQRDAQFTGAEFAGQLDLAPLGSGTLGVDGQYDVVRAQFSDGANVPRIPPMRLGGGVFWRDQHWFTRIGLLHAFAQNNIAPNETPTEGYNLLKAEIAFRRALKPTDAGPREFVTGLTGTNLLNDEMRNHVSFKKDEVLLPGRSIKFYATLRF